MSFREEILADGVRLILGDCREVLPTLGRNIACVIDAIQIGGWVYRGCVPWHKGDDQRPRKGWFRSNVEYVIFGSCGPLLTGHLASGICADGIVYCRGNGSEKEHQTGKPVALMAELMSVRPEWETVLDPFMGSGTTGVAAVKEGKRFIGVEIDPAHFETALRRISAALAAPSFFIPRPEPARQEALL
jgi:site-specific DNA-methyltransferase (adenine-specific)